LRRLNVSGSKVITNTCSLGRRDKSSIRASVFQLRLETPQLTSRIAGRKKEAMHKVRFYPVGNGDTSQVILQNSRRVLFDFCHRVDGEDPESPLMDLKKRLREELQSAGRDEFDVVAFTHGDDDHISNSTEFFELLHAQKYQGKGRVKIKELWVPAAMVLEPRTEENKDSEVIIWREEARYRLRQGKGIRVFSKPEKLKEWLDKAGIPLERVRHLITDAGQLVPGFTLQQDGVEFFVHSPFIKHTAEGDVLRNECTLIFQVRFEIAGVRTDFLEMGDADYDVLEDMVSATKAHKNDHRLNWNLFNIPHHCSYKALSPEKGDRETIPTEKVRQLLLSGQTDAYIVSSSNPIPDDAEAYKQDQPPHIQARKAYERYLRTVNGRKFLVTMSEPTGYRPDTIEFEIDQKGLRRSDKTSTGSTVAVTSIPPRAG
jgi:hypothetical protein